MASKFDRRTLLAGGAAAAAGFAGASTVGWDDIAGAASNGPGRNGVTKATPKKGGSLVFGVDAEEQGFDPTQGRFDEVGVMYARTVFDPLTIVLDQRRLVAVPGSVGRAQLVVHGVDHHAAPRRHVPRRHALRRRRARDEPPGAIQVPPDGRRHQPDAAIDRPNRAARGHHHVQAAVGALPLLPGRRHRRPDRLRRRALDAFEPERHVAPRRHRALRVQGVDPQRPLHRDGQPELLAQGPAVPVADHVQADPRRGSPGRGAQDRHHRHHDHRHAADHHAVPRQPELLVHRRQHQCGG